MITKLMIQIAVLDLKQLPSASERLKYHFDSHIRSVTNLISVCKCVKATKRLK